MGVLKAKLGADHAYNKRIRHGNDTVYLMTKYNLYKTNNLTI